MNAESRLVIRQDLQRDSGSAGDAGFRLTVDLDLPGSGITILFGRSGCGKSTLLRCVAGLEPSVTGSVRIGNEVWQDSTTGIRLAPQHRAVGYVFQEGALFTHLTVRGNLEFAHRRVPPGRRRIESAEVIELLGLAGLLERRPQKLSGGERQRVALARALLASPALLLLDEPLAALDRPGRRSILPFLETLTQRFPLPVLYVTHYLNEAARLGDHLVYLDAGRGTGSGPLSEMLTDPDSPLTREQEAGAVLTAQVTGRDEEFNLARLSVAGEMLYSPDPEAQVGRSIRLRVLARDVSLSLEPVSGTTILNVLPCRVIDVTAREPGRALVRLALGRETLLAMVTQKSAAALDLRPGRRVFAQIKSVALL